VKEKEKIRQKKLLAEDAKKKIDSLSQSKKEIKKIIPKWKISLRKLEKLFRLR